MSWNWKAEKEDKEYEIKGTVTIGTDEYRDLIQETCDLRSAGQKEHDDWYKEYVLRQELEKKVKAYEEKLEEINEFWDSDESLRLKFRLWKAEKIEKEESEDK